MVTTNVYYWSDKNTRRTHNILKKSTGELWSGVGTLDTISTIYWDFAVKRRLKSLWFHYYLRQQRSNVCIAVDLFICNITVKRMNGFRLFFLLEIIEQESCLNEMEVQSSKFKVNVKSIWEVKMKIKGAEMLRWSYICTYISYTYIHI